MNSTLQIKCATLSSSVIHLHKLLKVSFTDNSLKKEEIWDFGYEQLTL